MKTKKVTQPLKAPKAAPAPTPVPMPAAPAPPVPAPAVEKKARAKDARLARVVTVLVANPKKPTSKAYARFNLYRTGATVADYLKAGGKIGDLAYDLKHKFIALT